MAEGSEFEGGASPDGAGRPGAVLATTDQPVTLAVREIEDDRTPDGMACLGTFLDGALVARCGAGRCPHRRRPVPHRLSRRASRPRQRGERDGNQGTSHRENLERGQQGGQAVR